MSSCFRSIATARAFSVEGLEGYLAARRDAEGVLAGAQPALEVADRPQQRRVLRLLGLGVRV